jgi:hypothetical protein
VSEENLRRRNNPVQREQPSRHTGAAHSVNRTIVEELEERQHEEEESKRRNLSFFR